jgi:predicted dehydrogenase
MQNQISRRRFLQQSAIGAGSLAAIAGLPAFGAARSPNEKLRVGIIGCNGRGMSHIRGFLAVPNVEIVCICDVDSRAVAKGIDAVAKTQQTKPKGVKDLKRMLDDPVLDAVSIATPDHWHAPAAILACAAGKHVYVEKPGSHNGHESELLVAAARKYKRVVQMGNQRRSWPWVMEAMNALHSGEIGKGFFARAWYTSHRDSIGRGKQVPVPAWLDYSLWQGPAPERPFRDNILHYNWHWFWNWGTGELGNNGVHGLDLARWGLGVGLPQRITCGGNRYHYVDDWETPDTCIVTFDFGNCGISWEGRSCDPQGYEGAPFGVSFYGEKGSLTVSGNDYRIYDLNNKILRETKGKYDDVLHFANFCAGIREGQKLNSEIEDGQNSTLLCHLGNIAWRTGHTLNFDSKARKILQDRKASALWNREYRQGWAPRV